MHQFTGHINMFVECNIHNLNLQILGTKTYYRCYGCDLLKKIPKSKSVSKNSFFRQKVKNSTTCLVYYNRQVYKLHPLVQFCFFSFFANRFFLSMTMLLINYLRKLWRNKRAYNNFVQTVFDFDGNELNIKRRIKVQKLA